MNTDDGIQRRLDAYRHWYNTHRPSSALQGRTPDEAWEGATLSETLILRARDPQKMFVSVVRRQCHGDPELPVIDITLRPAA